MNTPPRTASASQSAPRTSIITLTCERPEYLAEAVAWVEAQTDRDWEHLVYDNCSRDPRVAEVLKAAKARNPERFFYASPGARGPVVPALYWNILIGLARGQYITILDDDNRKHPEFLERMLAAFTDDTEAVSCGWRHIDGDGKPFDECHWNLLTSMPKLWQSNTIDSNALVVRRSVFDKIGQFDASLAACEDWHFIARLARSCSIKHLPEALVDHREHPSALSKRVAKMDLMASWNRIRSELFTDEERDIARSGKV